MTRDELDMLWQQALVASVRDGEQYTRYHFAKLVAKAEREACASFIENWKYAKECAGCDQPTPDQYAAAIRARGEV